MFKITKILYGQNQPTLSVVGLQKGDIQSEFEHYMEKSEQIPSALLFETSVDDQGAGTQVRDRLKSYIPPSSLTHPRYYKKY